MYLELLVNQIGTYFNVWFFYYSILIIFCFIGYLFYYNYVKAVEVYMNNHLNSTQKSSSSSSSSTTLEIALPKFDDIVQEVKYPPINVNIPGEKPIKVEYNKLQEILKTNNMPEYSFVDILKNMSKHHTTKHIFISKRSRNHVDTPSR